MPRTQKKDLSVEEKLKLVTRNLQEVVGSEELIKKLKSNKDFSIYWGTAPTGKPHLGYFVPMYKIADFLDAGCEVTILFANIHAYLDNMKTSWDLLEKRTKYYELLIKEMLSSAGVPLTKLKFVKGTDFQLSEKYTLDVYKMSALATTKDTQKAGAEVVKQLENPKLSGLLYPILQSLDEVYLKVDAQFGGVDQRKIFMFAREFLPMVGYEKRIHLMNPLIPGLGESGKMSSSEPNSKIDFEDSDQIIKQKVNKAYCIDGVPEGNGLLAILKYILFRKIEKDGRSFVVNRPEKYGGKIEFKDYSGVERAFSEKRLSSIDLKQSISDELISFIAPLRSKLEKHKKLIDEAYPTK